MRQQNEMNPEFHLLTALIPQTKTEAATDAIVVAALSSPVWLTALKEASEIMGLILPIVGVIWIVTKIVTTIMVTRRMLEAPHLPPENSEEE
jgi:Na+/alanine symporter